MNTTTLLKQMVGDAGAGHDESHGSDTTRDVLVALASMGPSALNVSEDPAVAVAGGLVVDATGRYDVVLAVNVGTTGTAGQTDVELQLNAVTIAGTEVSVINTDADGTSVRALVQDVLLTQGDLLTIDVTAADASADLGTYSLYLRPVRPE